MQPAITLASGSTTDPFFVQPDGWVVIEAGSASATLQYTTGTPADITNGTATWVTAGSYTGFTAIRADEELADTWVKLTAANGAITYHVEGELSKTDRLTIRGYKKTSINSVAPAYALDKDGNVTGLVGPGGGVIPVSQPLGNRVLLLGDSITYNCGATFNTDGGNDGRSWIAVANSLAGAPLNIVHNSGISGNTSAQILARLSTDVFAYSFDRVILMCGTNDPGNLTITQSKANFSAIVSSILGRGYGVDIVIPPPKTWTLPTSASQLSMMLELFNYQRRIATTTPGCRVLGDAYSVLVSPTATNGDWNDPTTSGDTTPYIHPNNKGAALIGLSLYPQLLQWYPPASVLPVSAAEVNANTPFELFSDPLMQASTIAPGGTFTGLVPTGWSSNALTGAAAACAVVSSVRGIGNDIEITITASGAGSLSLKKTWSSALQNAFLSNGPYVLRVGGAVQIMSGTNITSAYWSAGFGGSAPLSGTSLSNPAASPASLPATLVGKLMTQTSGDIPINTSQTNAGVFGSYSQLLINVTFNAAGSAVVRFTSPFVRVIQ